MSARGALAATLVAVAALLLPAGASAAPKPAEAEALLAPVARIGDELSLLGQGSRPLGLFHKRFLSELKFTNRDGYTIDVVAFGQTVALTVDRGQGSSPGRGAKRSSATTYLAHGRVTPNSIEASFADRGRIAVRFRPAGRQVRATRRAGCRRSNDGLIGRLGVFVGDLRFRGEGGYTSAEVHRIHGGSVDFAALIACLAGSAKPGRNALQPAASSPLRLPVSTVAAQLRGARSGAPGVVTHPSHGPKRTILFADEKLPLSRIAFGAERRGGGRTRFLAVDERSEGSLGIIRFAIATGSRSSFSFDGHLASAAVAPPAPFSGRGAFLHGPGSEKSWSGSLAVSFLGAPDVPLTGAPFRTLLAQSW
jgi:hypothetical protein